MLAPFINLFLRLGISPDAVTLVGTAGVSFGALWFFPRGQLLAGVLFITAFVFSDLIDGQMARRLGRQDTFGAFWDSTLDRIADGAVFGGAALYFAGPGESTLYLWLSLITLVMGATTSYARARAETLGFQAQVGIAERPDRLVGFLVPTGLGAIFGVDWLIELSLWVLAVAATVTVVQRVWVVRRQALAAAYDSSHE
jgi:CDP-diacylglycerol--glycerol-3-phosphate 3-phosphatidyltransferase/CDP-diacylglycerol--inositol 3-phosphatidyltransferase